LKIGDIFLFSRPETEKEFVLPKGPQGQKRPADAIARAVMVAKIATGEIDEETQVSTAAAELGRRGGTARALTRSPERRREIPKAAARARYPKP
jgi:hypothetical protein